MLSSDVVVVGAGAVTCLGLNALQSAMGIRAEVFRPAHTALVDHDGKPVIMCTVPTIAQRAMGIPRLVGLARAPLVEALQPFRKMAQARFGAVRPLPLVVALPSEGRTETQTFVKALDAQVPDSIDLSRSEECDMGRAGGVAALACADTLLSQGADAVIVGGVDSYLHPARINELCREFRLHTDTTENGFTPGEGAAFVVVSRGDRSGNMPRLARISGHALESEPRPFGSDEPCHALGMTAALKHACQKLAGETRVGWQLTDVVCERHRVDEWAAVVARLHHLFDGGVVHHRPGLQVGDLGAASVPLMMVVACIYWQTGCGVTDTAVIAAHSDGPERGAILICRPT